MKHTDRDPFLNTPRNLRLDARLKLRQVAELIGTTPQLITRLERHRGNPTAYTLACFYAAVGRDDLIGHMLHVLDDEKQDHVLSVYEEWERRYGPGSLHGRTV